MSADRSKWEPVAVLAANTAGLDPTLFVAMIQVESGFDPDAASGAGAIGIAQIVPRWHPGVDVRDPYASLQYAARLLASHLRTFGSERLALAAYNAGAGAVQSVGNRVPDNGETPAYVEKVLALRGVTSVLPEPVVSDEAAFDDPSRDVVSSASPRASSTVAATLANPDPFSRRNIALIAAAIATMVIVFTVVSE